MSLEIILNKNKFETFFRESAEKVVDNRISENNQIKNFSHIICGEKSKDISLVNNIERIIKDYRNAYSFGTEGFYYYCSRAVYNFCRYNDHNDLINKGV